MNQIKTGKFNCLFLITKNNIYNIYKKEAMQIRRLTTKIHPYFKNNKNETAEKLFHKNGRVKFIKKADGTEEHWSESGKLELLRKPNGTVQSFYENGALHFERKTNGAEKSWYPTGDISYSKEADGTMKSFYQNGQIKCLSRPDFTCENWDEHGVLRFQKLSDGTTIFYPQATKKVITHPNGKSEITEGKKE